MSVVSVDRDLDSLSLTLLADFDAPVEWVWQLWADPRLLERWGAFEVFPLSVGQMDALLTLSLS